MRIDLRTHAEVAACPAPAHVVLDVPKPPLTPQQIAAMAAKLAMVTGQIPRTTHIEVFCAKGNRSRLAAAILRQAGFTDVVDLGAARCQPALAGAAFAGVTDVQRKAIVSFIRKQRVSDDAAFHAFAKSIGVDPDDAEPVVYQLAHDLAWQLRAHHVMFGVLLGGAAVAGAVVWARSRR